MMMNSSLHVDVGCSNWPLWDPEMALVCGWDLGHFLRVWSRRGGLLTRRFRHWTGVVEGYPLSKAGAISIKLAVSVCKCQITAGPVQC